MFRKGRLLAACLIVMITAVAAYSVTYWQVTTKLGTVGGTIKIGTKALQTTAGTTVYNSFPDTTTSADAVVTANAGYEITSITQNGTALSGVAGLGNYTVPFAKPTPLSTQSLAVNFKAKQYSVTGTVAAPGGGTITPASTLVTYNSNFSLTATPTTSATYLSGYTVNGVAADYVPRTGAVNIPLTGISANTAVVATFAAATANAGGNKVVAVNVGSTLRGTGAGTLLWTVVSEPTPGAITIASPTSATTAITPTAVGTYVLKLSSMLGTTELASSTVTLNVVASLSDAMQGSCDGCHNATTGVVPSQAYTKWSTSAHLTAQVSCISCHTDGPMPTPVNSDTVQPDTYKVLNAGAGTVGANFCSKCHSSVTHIAAVAPNNNCTRCHTNGEHNPATFFSFFDPSIATMHVFGKATPTAGATADGQGQTQYVTQGATCDDCHATQGETPQNVSFAESGHGKTSSAQLNAFVHYDWSGRTNNGTRQNGNCDRCHTAGGFVKLLGDDPALATRLTPVAGLANNVLVCVACHNDLATGGLRIGATPAGNPTPLSGGYFALFSSAGSAVPVGKTKIQVAFPGYKNSSICIPCHSGRSTDDVFVAVIDRAKADLKNYTTIQTGYYQHAANMGQSFIGKGAFNFNGGDYVGANGHAAVKNGAADTQGPCVGCHYSKDGADHSLEPVGYTAVCQSCHAAPFGATDVDAKKAEYEAGLKILDALIRSKFDGLRTTSSPLETERANVRFGRFGKAAGVAADDATAKKAYGAWYNWQLLSVWDSAAFVHNPTFARTVLMDTIDYLDDASVNGTAAATIAASTALPATPAITPEEAEKAGLWIETPACASCHAAKATLVQSGKHAAEVSTHSGTCGRCHTSEGYVAFLATNQNPAGVYSASFNGSQNVSCAACHDQHGTVRDVAWAPQPAGTTAAASKEYKLCTSCHNLTDANGNIMASGLTVNGQATVAMQQHNKDWYRNIASTHYDLPTTGFGLTNTSIEGYVVRYNKDTACTDCHGHNFYTNTGYALETPDGINTSKGVQTVQTEWASSGHAGKILKAKFTAFTTANAARTRSTTTNAAVMAVGVTGTSGPAWEHYDWDNATGGTNDRKACQKCHTATGSSNFLNDPTTYNSANNDFSHLTQWSSTSSATKTSPQNEVLYCWGCHKSAETGELRVPTAGIPADFKFKGANFNYPNVGASTVCFGCHGGRVGGENITALTTAANTFTNVGFQNSHYMAAASLMYVKGGYTNFIDPTTVIGTSTYGASLTSTDDGGALSSTHRKLGTAAIIGDHGITAEMGVSTGGPCATCHYANGNHELELGKDAFEKVCVNCHTAEGATTLTAANYKEFFVEEQAAPFKDALALAIATLKTKYNITYDSATNPYFFDDTAFPGQPHASATQVKDWTRGGALSALEAEKLMGACFNINLLNREPAAYVHARTYTRRLIYDSIDFLDNKAIDMSVGTTAVAYDAVKYVKGATALDATTTESYKYLSGYNRTTGVWNALQRP